MRSVRTVAAIALLTVAALAQSKAAVNINRDKQLALSPPPGHKVAIVMFEDMQCPDCARAHPLVYGVAKAQNVPVVRHDFPLPIHDWAFEAAVWGRYFDSKSKKLGDGFRDYVYANQPAITPQNLKDYVKRFAEANGTSIPFVRDPGGKFEKAVRADYALGQKIGVQHTPTIWVVGATKGMKAEPFVEVVERSKMSQMIEDMRRAAGGK
jgi:protein-disulfide isomerase